MAVHFKQVAIVGVGLIGGSLGMVLKRQALAGSVVGIGRRIENLKTAVQLGAIDRYVSDAQEGVRCADLVVLATPVDSYERHLKAWGSSLEPGAIVSDVGSVKGPLVEQAERLLPGRARFVGGHPIAGREKTGVAAGSADLFRGARCILDRKSTRLNSSHSQISYAVFCLKKKKKLQHSATVNYHLRKFNHPKPRLSNYLITIITSTV